MGRNSPPHSPPQSEPPLEDGGAPGVDMPVVPRPPPVLPAVIVAQDQEHPLTSHARARRPAALTFPIIRLSRERKRRGGVLALATLGMVAVGFFGMASLLGGPKLAPAPSPQAAESASDLVPNAVLSSLPAEPSASSPVSAQPTPPSSGSATLLAMPVEHFSLATAKKALDASSRELASCRRGKMWGFGSAVVRFANDGSVESVTMAVPFAGTPAAACVAETLSLARLAPFGGKPGAITYRFYVSSH